MLNSKKRAALRIAALLLCSVMLLSFAGCKDGNEPIVGPDDDIDVSEPYVQPEGADTTDIRVSGQNRIPSAGKGEVKYTFAENEEMFTLHNADVNSDRSAVTLNELTVSAINFNSYFEEDGVAKYQAKVQITGRRESGWNALYFGMRLPKAGADAQEKAGVWIAFCESYIGIRTNKWPETTLVKLKNEGVDFRTERMLYIEDDSENDVITVYADDDSGKKVLLATVKLEGENVSLYLNGSESPDVTDSGVAIEEHGYVNIWLHHMNGPAYIKELTATSVESVVTYTTEVNMLNMRDNWSDTWTGTDDLGRSLDTENRAATNKKVGIFYFLWHDPNVHGGDGKIYDHSATYYSGGTDALKDVMTKGPLGFAHYWAEPYFGYYRSDDEWVIRKHTQMLVDAGVDFVFIDVTNGQTYDRTYRSILKIWESMREEGVRTPDIAFHCGINMDVGPTSYRNLWSWLYSKNNYSDLWFYHDGKPLIFLPEDFYYSLPKEQREFFTVRFSWADTNGGWYANNNGYGCWPWADMYPQKPGKSFTGEVEQMIVMSGFWANGSFGTNAGRSYSYKNGGQPADSNFGFTLVDNGSSGKGIAFNEQFDLAIEYDPDLIMIVGWNEWWAGRWETGAGTGQTIANTYRVTDDGNWTRNYFVDNFNPEFSRDIEPVKGLYNDNYYYQMADRIREYKGTRNNVAAFGQRAIDINGPRSAWDIVGPEYRDDIGDVTARDARSYVGGLRYQNDSGRNDFVTCKVTKFDDKVVFYAECADKITDPEGTNWMNLFVNSDCKSTTGWYGFNYLINASRDGSTCSVEKFKDGSWEKESVGTADFVVKDNYIQISVSASLLNLGNTFDFKWADNSVDDGDIMKFTDMGDTAPDYRFCYRYTTKQTKETKPSVLTDDMIVLKAGSYYAYAGGEMVRLDTSSTKATFFGDNNHLYVPKAFAEEKAGIDTSKLTVFNHYGVEYVDIRAALKSTGRTLTEGDGIVVIADSKVEEAALLTLYRSLY